MNKSFKEYLEEYRSRQFENTPDGESCEDCNGSGKEKVRDAADGQYYTDSCTYCGGSGKTKKNVVGNGE